MTLFKQILAHRIYDEDCHCHTMSIITYGHNGYSIRPMQNEKEAVIFYSGTIIPIKKEIQLSEIGLYINSSNNHADIAQKLHDIGIIASENEDCVILAINTTGFKILN